MKDKQMTNIFGWMGAFTVLFAYFLLSFKMVTSDEYTYNYLNLIGGSLLAYRVWQDKNYSNFILEVIFVIIALKSLIV